MATCSHLYRILNGRAFLKGCVCSFYCISVPFLTCLWVNHIFKATSLKWTLPPNLTINFSVSLSPVCVLHAIFHFEHYVSSMKFKRWSDSGRAWSIGYIRCVTQRIIFSLIGMLTLCSTSLRCREPSDTTSEPPWPLLWLLFRVPLILPFCNHFADWW